MRIKILFLILSLLVLIFFLERGSLDQTSKSKIIGKHPVTLLSPIKFRDYEVDNTVLLETNSTLLSDAFGNLGLLDLKIDSEGVYLSAPRGETEKLATTCGEYLRLTDKGWFADSTAAMIHQKVFYETCELLRFLQGATPAHHTNLSKDLQWKNSNNLPRTMSYPILEPTEEYKCKESLSLRECVSQDQVEVTLDNNGLTINDGGGVHRYTLKARGDFNGDGWEEILVFYFYHATHGSLINYSYRCLTLLGEQDNFALTDCGKAAD